METITHETKRAATHRGPIKSEVLKSWKALDEYGAASTDLGPAVSLA